MIKNGFPEQGTAPQEMPSTCTEPGQSELLGHSIEPSPLGFLKVPFVDSEQLCGHPGQNAE